MDESLLALHSHRPRKKGTQRHANRKIDRRKLQSPIAHSRSTAADTAALGASRAFSHPRQQDRRIASTNMSEASLQQLQREVDADHPGFTALRDYLRKVMPSWMQHPLTRAWGRAAPRP